MVRPNLFCSYSLSQLGRLPAAPLAAAWKLALKCRPPRFGLVWVVLLLGAVASAQRLEIPQQFPLTNKDGQPNLPPPHVEQTNQCATKVAVVYFLPHATIRIYLVVPAPTLHKLIGGPVNSFFSHDAIPLTQVLQTNDEVEATQTINGVTSAYSAPMKVGAMPTHLDSPNVLPPFYACGQIVPVDGLVSGVKLQVQDATASSIIGTDSIPNFYSSDGWDPPTVSSLDAPPKTSPAHEVQAKQSASCPGVSVNSNYGPAKTIDAQPSGCHPPKVETPVINNDAVTLDDLYTGAAIQVTDSGMPDGGGLATESSNSVGLSHKITAASHIEATQKLCSSCGRSTPVTPTSKIPAPTLVSPICPGQPAAFVQNTTVNAALVLLNGTTVIGFGGAAPGQVSLYLAPPNAFSNGEAIHVAEFIGTTVVHSNTVTVGCQERMRWQDFISGPDGAKRLASLERGITKMKSLDSSPPGSADYRRSWAYWANIHGYYGNTSPDGTVEDQISYLNSHGLMSYDSYYTSITDQTAPDSIAQTVWATCQHSAGPTPETGQALNFFGWHRMWLYYLERVLRWAAADNTLRLPYWDYTNSAQLALPAEFQNTASVLYDSLRDPSINTGATTLSESSTNIGGYLMQSDYFTYEYDIESNVHGYVHCTTGPTCPVAHMGDVPVAGNDPIFPLHHANIDRFWACWQYLYPTPAGSWQNQQFSFVDETGAMVTKPVSDFLDSVPLGYVYDNVSDCGGTSDGMQGSQRRTGPMPRNEKLPQGTLGSVKNIAITRPETTVDISVAAADLQRLFLSSEAAAPTYLVLREVTAQGPPGVLFDVYLARKDDLATRQFAGTMSWFGAFAHHGSSGPMNRTFRFPVITQLRELVQGKPTSEFTVIFEATTGRVPVDRSKAEEAQAQAAKLFRPESNLHIGAIDLQTGTPSDAGNR